MEKIGEGVLVCMCLFVCLFNLTCIYVFAIVCLCVYFAVFMHIRCLHLGGESGMVSTISKINVIEKKLSR